ncbi:MAG TPA: aminopeptidase [Myxococcota bacterium]|jgi:aspartyl aminopeptidase|nr:aminopeptidase [Myxococcota bacterium]
MRGAAARTAGLAAGLVLLAAAAPAPKPKPKPPAAAKAAATAKAKPAPAPRVALFSVALSDEARAFGNDYRDWLSKARTALLAVEEIRTRALVNGFRVLDLDTPPDAWPALAPGDGVLIVLAGRTAVLARIGSHPIAAGVRLVAAHIDAPALRLDPHAAAKAGAGGSGGGDSAVLSAHAYGGLKPYHWSGRPLLLTGLVAPVHGAPVRVALGPADGFTFLLEPRKADAAVPTGPARTPKPGPHDPRDDDKPYRILAASAAAAGDAKGGAKARLYQILQDRYGLTAGDLEAAELYAVPAEPPRDAGLDRVYVLGPGQDDRACSYAALRALLETPAAPPPPWTAIAVLVDREEIGSTGASGMRSALFELALAAILRARGEPSGEAALAATLRATTALSADVKAGVNPLFPEVHDLKNAPFVGRGPTIVKATGSGGKYGASDARPELGAFLRRAAAAAGVPTQDSESGKVDEGGGGTVAKFLAARGADVIDVGIPVLSMHAPHELTAKADVYNMARLMSAFFEAPAAAPATTP